MSKTIAFSSLSVEAAKIFRDNLDISNVYIYIADHTTVADPANPPDPQDCDTEYRDITTQNLDILYLQKLSKADSTLAIPKKPWVYNTTYDQYTEDAINLPTENFYVNTSANKVYKCISNGTPNASTILPTSTIAVGNIELSDGYIWKFMFDIDGGFLTTFDNNSYLPVPTETQRTANQILVEASADPVLAVHGAPVGGHGFKAEYELFANNVIISKSIDLSFLGASRQCRFGIWINPTHVDGTSLTNNHYQYSLGDLDTLNYKSGRVLTVTNNVAFTGSDATSEQIMTILKF